MKLRRCHPDENEREAANNALQQHLERNKADRCVDKRLEYLSELSAQTNCVLETRSCFLRLDGLDQGKTKVPLNVSSSKLWSELWRPQLHCVGAMVEGLLECYYLADADVNKDSNMEMTVISLVLDEAAVEYEKRGLTMPEVLMINYDNTGREGKNHMWQSTRLG